MNVLEEFFRPPTITKHIRPPLELDRKPQANKRENPIRLYAPVQDMASGYGRLKRAIMSALGASEVKLEGGPNMILSPPWTKIAAGSVMFTMWEADMVPPDQRDFLKSPGLIVPCTHNVATFRRSGYSGPIKVVPLWGEAKYAPLPDDSTLKFICIARDNGVKSRKGIDELISWFKEAFPNQSDVGLTLKMSHLCYERHPNDSRISIVRRDWDQSEYEAFIASHHCGVFLSGMEGWNLPACELMATGRPSLVVPYSGPADFTTRYDSYPLGYDMVRAPNDYPYNGYGLVAAPIKESVIETLRSVYNDRTTLRSKAAAAYEASKLYTKELFASRLKLAVDQLLSTV